MMEKTPKNVKITARVKSNEEEGKVSGHQETTGTWQTVKQKMVGAEIKGESAGHLLYPKLWS